MQLLISVLKVKGTDASVHSIKGNGGIEPPILKLGAIRCERPTGRPGFLYFRGKSIRFPLNRTPVEPTASLNGFKMRCLQPAGTQTPDRQSRGLITALTALVVRVEAGVSIN